MAYILIVEDDVSMLGFLRLALEKAGHSVHTAENGIDGHNALKKDNKFDLLLTDIVMPGMDGIELSKEAEKLKPEIKIMFITGFSAIAVGHEDIDPEKAQILSKPFHLNDLVKQVETLLEK